VFLYISLTNSLNLIVTAGTFLGVLNISNMTVRILVVAIALMGGITSNNEFQRAWEDLVTSVPSHWIDFIGTLLVQVVFFLLVSTIYTTLDAFAPKFAQRHKVQPLAKQPSKSEIQHCVSAVLQGQIISWAIAIIPVVLSRPPPFRVDSEFPSMWSILRDITLSIVLREIMFYYAHRILHHRVLYKYIHKKHHRFTAPIAFSAQYAHPIEQIFANVLPIVLPPRLLKSHILTFWLFLSYELFTTATVHSGYDFFNNAARMHDLHHEKFNVNYGALGFLDKLHGTDKLRG
jgi:sterol desaturase/sphingolipid hydroxylase (fatty acid hydroxylase superfamily)